MNTLVEPTLSVMPIAPHLSSIQAPAFLANKPIWLMWRFEQHEGEPKPRKVPYYVNGSRRYGVQGRPEDRQQLTTFEAARAAAAKKGFSGIGHACLDGDFTVIDFDRCAPGGKLDPRIEAMATASYAEYSPSGEGVHLYALGNLNNNVKSVATADQFGVELFSTKGFVSFTGTSLEITDMMGVSDTIAEPGPELKALIRLRFGATAAENPDDPLSPESFGGVVGDQEPLGVPESLILEALDVLDNEMHYDTWLAVGMAIHHETRGEGFAIWDEWSQRSSKYTTPDYGLYKWESFGRNPSKQITIRSLVQLANEHGAHLSLNAVSMEDFEDLSSPADVVATDELEALPSVDKVSKNRFPVEPWHLFAVQSYSQYLIKGLIPKADLGVLFGESGSGKSFIMLDMCVAVARGQAWRGLRTTQGRVVYVVAEGAAGFRNRLIAYANHHQIDPQTIPLDIINATPNLLLKEDALDVCKSILQTGIRPSLVVIDTLAQAMAGANENASDDMGKALAHCKGIHKATGAMVMLVHHAGKDASKGARGWSGMRAAADVELEVSRSAAGRALRTTKQKDGADFQEWGFGLNTVHIGVDIDGDPVTSCVVVEAEIPQRATKVRERGPNEQAVVDAMTILVLANEDGVDRKALLDEAMKNFPEAKNPKVKRNGLDRALKNMCLGQSPIYIWDEATDTINQR